MIFREANIDDVEQIQRVRNAVKENMLSNPNLVTDQDCIDFISVGGKGWVCQTHNQIVGFSIVDLKENNVWALFVNPNFEKKGIGRQLHDTMMNWYFLQTQNKIWLSTDSNTRAEQFYRKSGWVEVEINNIREIKFKMTYQKWKKC